MLFLSIHYKLASSSSKTMYSLNSFRMMHVYAMIMSIAMLMHSGNAAGYNELFKGMWAPDHIVTRGNQTTLSLDQSTGCGFESQKKYLFGKASAQIKLVAGDSAGTVTAYYMTSDSSNHDELDFEFLGNVSGEPYIVQTNLYINGTGNREQRHFLWFDPTVDFHTYSFLWNRRSILFLIDDIPIREFANKEKKGVPFPKNQAMGIHGSLWNADDWATQGGKVKTNWTLAPFEVTFQAFEIDGCELGPDETSNPVVKCGKARQFWWDKPVVKEVNKERKKKLEWVKNNYLVYDYCQDTARFSQMPQECMLH